jgi:hypothetical protein
LSDCFASAIAALLAVAATGVAIYHADKSAEKQIRQDQRPWLYINPKDTQQANFDVLPEKGVSLELKITNFGKTPALRVKAQLILEKLLITQQPTFKVPGNQVTTGAIFPTDSPPIVVSWLGRPNRNGDDPPPAIVSPDDFKDWETGKIYFAIYGRVEYWDIFGVGHLTHYCAARAAPVPNLKLETKNCIEKYNEADGNVEVGPAPEFPYKFKVEGS